MLETGIKVSSQSTVPEIDSILIFSISRNNIFCNSDLFLNCVSIFLKKFVWVGRQENLFIFFWMAIKTRGTAGLVERQAFLLFMKYANTCIMGL